MENSMQPQVQSEQDKMVPIDTSGEAVEVTLEDKKVKCPLHGSWFCLETGKALNEPAELPLKIFDVEIIDNDIYMVNNEK